MSIIEFMYLAGLSVLAIEISDSELSNSIKTLLCIDRERSILVAASKYSSYKRILPNWINYTLIIPLIIVCLMGLSSLTRMIVRLLQCPFCISFWLSFTYSLLYLNNDVLSSVFISGIGILITRLVDRFLIWK